MQIGVGRAELSFPPDFLPTEGFTVPFSPLYVRLVLFGGSMSFALLSVEMTSLPDSDIAVLKELVSRVAGVDKQHCWVCVTHTFSAPHILPDRALHSEADRQKRRQLRQALAAAVESAAQQAAETMAEASLSLGSSYCDVNANRDVCTPDGWWVGTGGDGPVNRALHLLSVTDLQGKQLVLLFHYSVQPSVMDGSQLSPGGRAVCADFTGVAAARLEQRYPGAVAIFAMGAAGDQAPVRKAVTEFDLHEQGWDLCNELGERLADAVCQARESSKTFDNPTIDLRQRSFTVPARQMPADIHDLHPTHSYTFVPDGERETTMEALRIGNIVILGVRPELNCVTASRITEQSPFDTTLVATMVNGGAKYMADSQSYDRVTYQAMNSPFGKGAAELLEQHAAALLSDIFTGTLPNQGGPA